MTEDAPTAQLVTRTLAGDAKAGDLLVRRYLRAAFAVALATVGRRQDAEDLAQEAFVVAFERLDTCREPERFAGWLLQIVRTRSLNFVAARKVREISPWLPRPEAVATDDERAGLRDRLIAALADLTPMQREVVLLHDLENWTHPEIAGTLGISEVNSRQHLFKARQTMRQHLADHAPENAHG